MHLHTAAALLVASSPFAAACLLNKSRVGSCWFVTSTLLERGERSKCYGSICWLVGEVLLPGECAANLGWLQDFVTPAFESHHSC